ncbi:DUF2076 domain-containing protein [Pseudomonas sp. RP23018S]|uniref:DUF2076 domain-containing protein n=1 Tax=Pseudomonas sp. RP23018S TaxID=3096037 RepID=UPI002AC9F3CD|nr:DUF2076 domain-containing protein [Pseudomonas sp. RP23018S]MDZ5604310.1 DUF2076 domain-containing protein [Pseudomonas sp. RP23018S]
MNTEEQHLIDSLFSRLRQAEDAGQPRDAQAAARIEEHLRQQPAAAYYMAQAILVQEAALKRLDEQNKQLQAELQQARAQPSQSSDQGSGGFLSSLFGGSARSSTPAAPPRPSTPAPSGGGWRDQGPGSAAAPVSGNGAPAGAAAPVRGGANSFLGGAMQTAAGVAGGVLLAQGISSLFGHGSQPQEVVNVIEEQPAPASDTGGWQDSADQRHVADNGGDDQGHGGFSDADYGSDDGGGFADDDTFI